MNSFKSESERMRECACLWVDPLSSICSGCQRGRQRRLSTNRQRMGRQSYLWCTLPSPTPSGNRLRRPHTSSASWKSEFTERPQGPLQTHIHSHCLSLRWQTNIHAQVVRNEHSHLEIKMDLLSCFLPFLSLVAKESHCKPLRWSLYTGVCPFWQGQLIDQSCSSWPKRWGLCLTLPFPNQQQSSPERQFKCSSQGCWPQFSHEQSNGRFWVGKFSFWIMSQLSSFHVDVCKSFVIDNVDLTLIYYSVLSFLFLIFLFLSSPCLFL